MHPPIHNRSYSIIVLSNDEAYVSINISMSLGELDPWVYLKW